MNDFSPVHWLIVLAWFFGLYLLPWIIALARKKQNSMAIFWLDLLAGWTFVGWIIALVWALTREGETSHPVAVSQSAPGAFCSACGKYSQPGAKFCSVCGAQFAA
jgi:Superinfection immunity protein